MRSTPLRAVLTLFLSLQCVDAMAPLMCPGGAPLGRFVLDVAPPSSGAPLAMGTVNQLEAGDTISYRPLDIMAPAKKKVRIALLLVPSDGSKILVFDPKAAAQPASWTVPFRTQLVSLVWGPEGLNKAKVASLVSKNNELIGQLADYATKSEETQALIQAITQQQTLDTGQHVDAAVAAFAQQYPSARIDPTQSTSTQLATLLRGVNPSLSAYDPLAQNPQQQAAQTAGLAAAVAGLFFGNGVGLAATGGAVLVNLHSLLFPNTQFLSALAQSDAPAPGSEDDERDVTGLCGSKAAAPPRTELAYLWALRIPDAPAPEISLRQTENLPIGVKSSIPLDVKGAAKGNDWKLAARVQDWKLVSSDDAASIPVPAKVNTTAKTIELDLTNNKLNPGRWNLAANWDWSPIAISGDIVLHALPTFSSAHLTPGSQDKLSAGAGTVDLDLTGDDFEFVRKIEFKKKGDPFAQPEPVPFRLPQEPPKGPENSVKLRLDAKPLATGNYVFLIAQADGKEHEAPFKVLPPAPTVSGTPMVLNSGTEPQGLVIHGTGLDRVVEVSADHARITLGEGSGDARRVTITLNPDAKAGDHLPLHLKVRDFEEPVTVDDAFVVAGPRPAITSVRESPQDSSGIALNPGEIATGSLVSFEINVANAPALSSVALSCDGAPEGSPALKISVGDAKEDMSLTQESPDALFLSFRPEKAGQSGCRLQAALLTARSGESEKRNLGNIVLLPKIESFQLTGDKAGDASYYAVIEGRNLETIAKVGWEAQTGANVDAIPAPISGAGNKESLRVAMPWPAPSPHAPLYVWLRGEERGRLTTARY